MRTAIGLDLGGTALKGGLVAETGRLLFKESRPSPAAARSPEAVVRVLVDFALELQARARAQGLEPVGFGFGPPNFIEGADWIQRQVNNLPALNDYPLRPPLAAALGEHIAIDNDVMNAGLAEYLFGAGQRYRRVF